MFSDTFGKMKAVTFSYDDGVTQDIRLIELLNKYGLKCTFNLTGKTLFGENTLSTATVTEKFLDRGHEVAVHGYFHRAPGMIPARPV